LQDLLKWTQIDVFGLKICHQATLLPNRPKKKCSSLRHPRVCLNIINFTFQLVEEKVIDFNIPQNFPIFFWGLFMAFSVCFFLPFGKLFTAKSGLQLMVWISLDQKAILVRNF
jgi:hypothetical protein